MIQFPCDVHLPWQYFPKKYFSHSFHYSFPHFSSLWFLLHHLHLTGYLSLLVIIQRCCPVAMLTKYRTLSTYYQLLLHHVFVVAVVVVVVLGFCFRFFLVLLVFFLLLYIPVIVSEQHGKNAATLYHWLHWTTLLTSVIHLYEAQYVSTNKLE